MIYALSTDIQTPFGDLTATLQAVRAQRSALGSPLTHLRGRELVQPVMGTLLKDEPDIDGYTMFESLCIRSAQRAITKAGIDVTNHRCVFILSSTKADIWTPSATTAQRIARYFGNETTPIVVSLACTSGVAAQLTAYRLLATGIYDTAVVIGADILIEFVVSGFQCVHAISEDVCRPFDKNRDGLNVGEAVGTMVLSTHTNKEDAWCLLGGAIHNDANHISGPSRTAEGALRCLQDCLDLCQQNNVTDDLACISVHGTATNYNDEMESIAIHRAGLDTLPVSALKGYWGHTMGAAGVVETIVTMATLDAGWIPAVKGFEEQGTTYPIGVSNEERTTNKHSFIKLLSGFGGVNAAILWTKNNPPLSTLNSQLYTLNEIAHYRLLAESELTKVYRQHINDWPKYFKMDSLSKMGFVGTQMALQQLDGVPESEHTCVIMANRISSTKDNREFAATIEDHNQYFPSPALFVYTVPNVVTGEIAIRHHLFGETSFYILNKEEDLEPIIQSTAQTTNANILIVGWLEEGEANIRIIEISKNRNIEKNK
ncbi:MAG: 3-oxoacyl-ACP synthase [Paludibacteraceae bacterium]|nr:3-oxoacyl-ACP synthase [Paludibacteraceae bacterium]